MQVIGCFFVNGGNLELNHSDVGAGRVAVAELWLQANSAFLIEAYKKDGVLSRDQSCMLEPGPSKRAIFLSSQ